MMVTIITVIIVITVSSTTIVKTAVTTRTWPCVWGPGQPDGAPRLALGSSCKKCASK